MAPVTGQEIDVSEFVGDAAPRDGKRSGHQHLVPGASVLTIAASQAPVPTTIDDHWLRCGTPAAWPQHRMSISANSYRVVHGRHVHGAQHPVRHVGRSRNLQKMPSRVHGHGRPSRSCLGFASRSNIIIRRACPSPGGGRQYIRRFTGSGEAPTSVKFKFVIGKLGGSRPRAAQCLTCLRLTAVCDVDPHFKGRQARGIPDG